ncbi:MAG TPA: hypothetical protein VHL54_12800, partial [Actinomycetota bacterium]|nr:hypothetical protein [Actinomycetota bacterium]
MSAHQPLVVVGGSLAQRPHYGGHSWVLLQYLLGFRDLGYEVLFLDRLDPGMAVDAAGRGCPVERSVNWRYLNATMREAGLHGRFALLIEGGRRTLGMPRSEVLRRVGESELFLNVMGFVDVPEVLEAARTKVFLDIDPGFGQMWKQSGLADIFGGHDLYLTVGGNLGKPGCTIPEAGIDWTPTRPPVVLDRWPATGFRREGFTSVGSWRGPFEPVDFEGTRFGLRVHEFRRFADLPRLAGGRFRLAMEIDPEDAADRTLLTQGGWGLEDPREAAGDPWTYRRYVQEAMAEFGVAKGMYVRTRSGWISDRSVCFLASGKPVLAQETGLSETLPTGEGLVTFGTLAEAADGAARITGDYRTHSARARMLAEEYFDSRKVLAGLASLVGVS